MGGKFGEVTLFEHLAKENLVKKVWQINRSDNRLLIVSTNLDGFSLAKHGPNSSNFPAIRYYTFYRCHYMHTCSTCIRTYCMYIPIRWTLLLTELLIIIFIQNVVGSLLASKFMLSFRHQTTVQLRCNFTLASSVLSSASI